MVHARTMAFLVILMLPGQALAQKPAADSVRPRLNFLAGSFATDTKIPPNREMPNGGTGKGSSVITWTLDSMFLAIEQQSTSTVLGEYKGRGMLGYDRQVPQYVLSMFNNFGDRLTYTGNFAGDTLRLSTSVPMPGRPFEQELLWYKEGDTVTLKV